MQSAQLAVLKTDVLADPALATLPASSLSIKTIIDAYAADAAPDFWVWNTAVDVQVINDAIDWAALTPANQPPISATPSTPTAGEEYAIKLWTAKAILCQAKQFNIQIITEGRQTISGAKPNVRAGLQDALTNVPSATGGLTQGAGWGNVKAVLMRKGNRLEKLFATGAGTTASPATMVVEGGIDYADVVTMMGW